MFRNYIPIYVAAVKTFGMIIINWFRNVFWIILCRMNILSTVKYPGWKRVYNTSLYFCHMLIFVYFIHLNLCLY